jgi:AcrR family transcriptional regulator
MPKDTFHNLPEEKRQLIEDVSVQEFAYFGYDNAAINRIVEKCNIAKGSFYQYFEDKKDLFLHLLARNAEKKLEYISPVLKNPERHDFFTLIKESYISGLKFASDNPNVARLGNWLLNNNNHPVFKELIDKSMPKAIDFYSELLKKAVINGEIRKDIDIDFVSNAISHLNAGMMDYYFKKHEGSEFGSEEFSKDIMDTVDLMIDFIKNGVK